MRRCKVEAEEERPGRPPGLGHIGPCDKLKRPKRWSDWRRDTENKMRFLKIEEDEQKLNFIRSCAGAELTKFWEKEMRARFEAKVEEGARVEAYTYEQVVEDTKQTLLKLVNKDQAIINLLRLEQGSRGFMDYLCHNWESLTGEDMKRIRDRMLAEKAMAEEHTLKQLI